MEHGRNRVPAALAYDDNNLTLAILIASETTVDAICLEVGGLDVSPKISAINLSLFAFTANSAALEFFRHGFAQLVQEDECRLIGQARSLRASACLSFRSPAKRSQPWA
jgi:hypothetical protein